MAASLRVVLCVLFVTVFAVFDRTEADQCPENSNWYICGTMCEPTCENPNPNPEFCPGIECTKLTGGCRCDKGFVRNTNTNACVPLSEC
ncbi:chymotrypsin inhibitor-like isoform X2 [Xylocopa sonorina]|uniref:chymotrypsin inhibitor-like isoform X2 n=1 Tax=Xylocopa sonorina TaxID=1818115 RepID=UPI00403A8652